MDGWFIKVVQGLDSPVYGDGVWVRVETIVDQEVYDRHDLEDDPLIGEVCILKRVNDWVLMSLRSKSSWLDTRMQVLWKTFLGRTMAWGGLAEDTLPARDILLTEMV